MHITFPKANLQKELTYCKRYLKNKTSLQLTRRYLYDYKKWSSRIAR